MPLEGAGHAPISFIGYTGHDSVVHEVVGPLGLGMAAAIGLGFTILFCIVLSKNVNNNKLIISAGIPEDS